MNLEEEVRLSFYKEITAVDKKHNVVLVQHTETGKIYVKKTLRHYDRSIFEFIKESRFAGIPVIEDLIELDNTLIVIEDYINGHSLDELLETGLFNEEQTVTIITAICDTLQPMHSCQPPIIHRDIKGSNIIIDNEGKIYLIDFDASKLVVQGKNRDTDLIGTEEYAAPEQYGFGQSDQRTDIYALGVLINRMLTGKFPSEEKYAGNLSHVITKATSLDPANRYQNVQMLKQALTAAFYGTSPDSDREESVIFETHPDTSLKRLLLHLPYPVRELPGFRSGRLFPFAAALLWYVFLIAFGFFGITTSPQYNAVQNRYYDMATFFILLCPTLYLGNYLGFRDRMPWRKSSNNATEVFRIAIGLLISESIVIAIVSVLAAIFKNSFKFEDYCFHES